MKGVAKLFGGGQMAAMQQAQAEQAAMLAEERRRLKLAEDAQLKVRTAGRGLLAYVDNMEASSEMATTLGGGSGSGASS